MTGRVWICSSMKFIFPWMYFFKVQDSDFLLPAQKKAVALIDLIGLGKLDSFLIKLKKYIRSRLSLFRVWDKEICWNFSPYADREICSSVWKPQPPLLIGFCSHLWIRGLELLKSVGVNHWRIGPSGWTDLEKFLKKKKRKKKRVGYLWSASTAVAKVCCLYLHLSKRRLCLVVCCYSSIWLLIARYN